MREVGKRYDRSGALREGDREHSHLITLASSASLSVISFFTRLSADSSNDLLWHSTLGVIGANREAESKGRHCDLHFFPSL